jgi:hypothetical protein
MPINLTPKILPKQKPFILLSKKLGLSIDTQRFLPDRIGLSDAKTVDVVVIASSSNLEQKKIITSFRDAQQRLVERVQEFIGYAKPENHRTYTYLSNYGNDDLTGRLVRTFNDLSPVKSYHAWSKASSEKQFVKRNDNGDVSKLTIAKVVTDGNLIGQVKNETHSLTEYYVPKVYGKNKKPNKFIEFETQKDDLGIPHITSSKMSRDVRFPQNDKYLAMRMYDSSDINVPIIRSALKENGLGSINIEINGNIRTKSGYKGEFDPKKGSINYSYKESEKSDKINTAYHESKHALQYAIMSATGDLSGSRFMEECAKKCSSVITPDIRKISQNYLNAHNNYTPSHIDYKAYLNNPLEVEARSAGRKGLDNYIDNGVELSIQFPDIPVEEL